MPSSWGLVTVWRNFHILVCIFARRILLLLVVCGTYVTDRSLNAWTTPLSGDWLSWFLLQMFHVHSTEPLQENVRIVPQKWTWFGMATQGVPFIFTNVVAFHKMVPPSPYCHSFRRIKEPTSYAGFIYKAELWEIMYFKKLALWLKLKEKYKWGYGPVLRT